MNLNYIVFGVVALVALLFYAWLEGLWFWTRPNKGQLDLEAEAAKPPKPVMTHDLNYIEGKTK